MRGAGNMNASNRFGSMVNCSNIMPDESQAFLTRGEKDELFGSVMLPAVVRISTMKRDTMTPGDGSAARPSTGN